MVGGVVIPSASAAGNLQFIGRSHVKGRRKWIKHVLVSISMFGLQLVWSTEMAYASPYLLSLGLSKSGMSAVFLAGPLSGLVVQPIIGSIADRSKSRFGRRRPVIVIGCVLCVVSLLIFGYTREVASVFTTWGSNAHSTLTIWLAVLAVYALDFAINGVQATDRALIVDVLPVSQQEEANAWVARLAGLGSILGFWIGNIDLLGHFSFLGDSQVKILSVFASLTLVIAHAITIFSVEEKVLLDDGDAPDTLEQRFSWTNNTVVSSTRSLWKTFRTLPPPILDICKVQAFAWGGWFPILFFSTTYVAEIYQNTHDYTPSASQDDNIHEADPATRAGSRAMFLQAVFSFVCSVVLPFLVSTLTSVLQSGNGSGYMTHKARNSNDDSATSRHRRPSRLAWSEPIIMKVLNSRFFPTLPFPWLDLTLLWMIAHIAFAVLMFSTFVVGRVWSATLVLTLLGAVTGWAPTSLLGQEILGDTTTAIKIGQSRLSTDYALASQQEQTDEAIALEDRSNGYLSGNDTGNSTFMTPNTTAVSMLDETEHPHSDLHAGPSAETPNGKTLQIRHSDSFDGSSYVESSDESDNEHISPKLQRHRPAVSSLSLPRSQRGQSREDVFAVGPALEAEDRSLMVETDYLGHGPSASGARTADQAGAILGIANIFVVLPQFLTSFLSSIVFALLSEAENTTPDGGTANSGASVDNEVTALMLRRAGVHVPPGSNDAIGFVFRIGGVSALVAAWLCWQMRRRKKGALDAL